jgi:hypothetical protein
MNHLVFFALFPLFSAFPNGAPACAINEQRIGKMGGSNTDLGYTIVPSSGAYTPMSEMALTLEGNQDYKGLLLFVSSAANPNKRLGDFVIPQGFKSNKAKCAATIQTNANGVLTHTDPTNKPTGTKFVWKPGQACEDAVVLAVVAKEQNQWQILKPVRLSCKRKRCSEKGKKAKKFVLQGMVTLTPTDQA